MSGVTIDNDVKRQPNLRRIVVALVVCFGVLLFVTYIIQAAFTKTKQTSPIQTKNTTVSKTTVPYQELTIPYLRERAYVSSLGPLEKVYDYSSYTGYLTSYTSDKLKINGLLTLPKGQQPKNGWPAIVFVHGYIPPTQYETLQKYVAYVDYLARSGFVVFKIDLRGHGQSEGKAMGGYFSSDYVIDTLNAYSALENSNFVNPKAIGLWGHSMAGNTVLRSLAVRPTIPAVVIWAGAVYSYTDQAKYGIHDTSYQRMPSGIRSVGQLRQQGAIAQYGRPTASSTFWKLVAPTNYLNDIKGAIEIHHAEDDETVNIGYSKDLVALLDHTNIPHNFYTYQTGGHNIADPSFSLAMERTVAFFKEYLK